MGKLLVGAVERLFSPAALVLKRDECIPKLALAGRGLELARVVPAARR